MNVFRGRNPLLVILFAVSTVSILLACFALFSISRPASAVPTTMNFQGRLADASGNTVANGTYNMQFRLFTVASGGSASWTETRETTDRVTVTNGLFSVQLGSVTPLSASLFSGNDVYFEITLPTPGTATCGTASCASWESAMTPRHKMATSAYAYNSETLDGLDSAAFGQLSAANAWAAANTFNNTVNVQSSSATAFTVGYGLNPTFSVNNSSNRVNIGSTTTDANIYLLALDSYNNGTDPTGVNGAMYYNTNTNKFRCYQNGAWADCIAAGGGGATTSLNNIASTNLSAALNTTSGNLTLQTTTSGNIILNPVGTVELQKNTNVTGILTATTSAIAPSFDRASAGALTIGATNATSIILGQDTTIANGKTLTVNGPTTLTGAGLTQNLNSTNYTPTLVGSLAGGTGNLDGAHAVAAMGKYVYVYSKWVKTFVTIDVSTPASPTVVGVLTDATHLLDCKQMVIVGKYAYMACNGNDSVQVVNISNPYAPSYAGGLVDATNLGGAKGIAASGNMLYIAAETSNKITAVSIANPTTPTFVGAGTTNVTAAKGVTVVGKYAYVAAGGGAPGSKALTIYDISSGTPSYLGSVSNATTLNFAQAVYVSGRYAYVASSSGPGHLTIIDVSVPSTPTIVGSVTTANTGNLQSVVVAGRYAYGMTNATNKMVVFDISNPASPTELTAVTDASVFANGQWLTMSGRYLYGVGDGSGTSNFFVVDTMGSDLVSANIGSIQGNTATITEDMLVGNTLNVANNINAGGNLRISGDIGSSGNLTISDTKGLTVNYGTTGTANAILIQGSGASTVFRVDNTAAGNIVVVGSGDCSAGIAGGRFCVNQTSTGSGTGAVVNNKSTLNITKTGAGASLYGNYVNLIDTSSSVANTLYGAYIDASGTTNTSATVVSYAAKIASGQAGEFLQFQNGASTVLSASNAGVLTATGLLAPSLDTATAVGLNIGGINATSITIGTSNTAGTLLVLDTKTSTGDPTGVDGSMYYNSSMARFRCYESGAWKNCTGANPTNGSTATQAMSAGTDTYVTASDLLLPTGGLQGPTSGATNGTKITWKVVMSKTAAGTAASTFTLRMGTAGTTGDASRCTFSTGAATAAVDGATVYITAYATAGGASSTLNCSMSLTHQLPSTGFADTPVVQTYSTAGSADSTISGTKMGLSFNAGTSSVITIQSVEVTSTNL